MKLRVLLESLSYSDALKLFNLDKDYTENDVLKKYKRLAIKFHPDKGGDVEKMQDLNYAKDLLLKNVTKEYKQPESRESKKSDYERNTLTILILTYLLNTSMRCLMTHSSTQ